MATRPPHRWISLAVVLGATTGLLALVYPPSVPQTELPNRIPQPPPYVTAEAQVFPPPFDEHWDTTHNPGKCATCHARVFEEWNGSMMSNAWRDPGWRGAFLLTARETSTRGNCDTPNPPDGTARASLNPFADAGCSSSFDIGGGHYTLAHSGSLLDGFCSQCHMPANFTDNIPLSGVTVDAATGLEHGKLDPRFNPTSDNGTGLAFATLATQYRNTDPGKRGVFCAVCHTYTDTRMTPFANYHQTGNAYPPVVTANSRMDALPPDHRDRPVPPDPRSPNQGYAIGAGSYRLSPHAIGYPEYFGPLLTRPIAAPGGASAAPVSPAANIGAAAPVARAGESLPADPYVSKTFHADVHYQRGEFSTHPGFYQAMHERAEMCSACHDVSNPLTIRNKLGRWVSGFPIERSYTEWLSSRYADRPGNKNFDPRFKRDCQTCHMQQDYGQPGTAQTLFHDAKPVPPLSHAVASDAPVRSPAFSHHFIGGNSYITRLIGAPMDDSGGVQPYPELSIFSFSSADEKSPYHNAYWTNLGARGAISHQSRLAWDRLRNVVDLAVTGPGTVAQGGRAPLKITVTNSGSGHKFPSGFPEGRVAWLSVRAFDLASGRELEIYDSHWQRTSLGVGYLTQHDMKDPNFPHCEEWRLPAGSPDPYAVVFKAVASQGDGCPTLDLAYAAPLNLVVNSAGLPLGQDGKAIDRNNPRSLPAFKDLNGDGDVFDDAYLVDSRLRPLPNPGSTRLVDRYSVVVPPGTRGPVAVTAAVYYQSFEAVVAKKFLGNLADTNGNLLLEPCVLGGACDGRVPDVEPAVVEGAPPVPMEVRSWVIDVAGSPVDRTPPAVHTYPADGAREAFQDVVVKAFFSRPVKGVDASTFTLTDEHGALVPAFVDQIGDGTWGLFPHHIFLELGKRYTAHLAAGICDAHGACTGRAQAWSFTVTATQGGGSGDTRTVPGFGAPAVLPQDGPPPVVTSASASAGSAGAGAGGQVVVAFSRPVMAVTSRTLQVREGPAATGCAPAGPLLSGRISSNAAGDRWTFEPARSLAGGTHLCLTVSSEVYDLKGRGLARPYAGELTASQPAAGARKLSRSDGSSS